MFVVELLVSQSQNKQRERGREREGERESASGRYGLRVGSLVALVNLSLLSHAGYARGSRHTCAVCLVLALITSSSAQCLLSICGLTSCVIACLVVSV